MYACMCAYVRPRRVCRKLIPNSSEWNNPKTNYLKYIHTQQVSYSDTFDTENWGIAVSTFKNYKQSLIKQYFIWLNNSNTYVHISVSVYPSFHYILQFCVIQHKNGWMNDPLWWYVAKDNFTAKIISFQKMKTHKRKELKPEKVWFTTF